MIKNMKLKGKIKKNFDNFIFLGKLCDNSLFSIDVCKREFQLNGEYEELDNSTPALLYVTLQAQQDHRCYIELPKPDIRFGKYVMVHESNLIDRNINISRFNPKIIIKKN